MIMKRLIAMFTLLLCVASIAAAQNVFPKWNQQAMVSAHTIDSLTKPYTVVIYGGVGCGFSKFLIGNLNVLDDCRDQCDVVLIMDQPKDSVLKHMPQALALYPTFSNHDLKYELKKKRDVYPQMLVFKHQSLVDHVVGVKEGMLSKTRDRIKSSK